MGVDRFPKYPKIQSAYKRDPDNNFRTFIEGEWSMPEFGDLADMEWIATEKINGTNCRIHISEKTHINERTWIFGGRSDNSQLHPDLMRVLNAIGSIGANEDLEGLTLYGEGYGAGIQKGGGNYRADRGFILFDVMVTDSGLWLNMEDVTNIAYKLGISVTPTVWRGTLRTAISVFRNHEVHKSDLLPMSLPEGWVLRTKSGLLTRRGGRIITKLKVADFPAAKAV